MNDATKRKQVLSAAALYFLEAGKYEKVKIEIESGCSML